MDTTKIAVIIRNDYDLNKNVNHFLWVSIVLYFIKLLRLGNYNSSGQ